MNCRTLKRKLVGDEIDKYNKIETKYSLWINLFARDLIIKKPKWQLPGDLANWGSRYTTTTA